MEKIGLQAVLEDAQFQSGLSRYLRGVQQASNATSQAASGGFSSLSRATNALGSNLSSTAGGPMQQLSAGTIALGTALGNLAADAIQAAISGLLSLGRAGFEAVASYEQMTLSVQSLVAREIARGEVIENTVTSIRHLTDEEILRLDQLRVEYAHLGESVSDAADTYGEMVAAHGESSLEALEASVALRELQGQLSETETAMNQLSAAEGSLVATTLETRVGTMSVADAMALASPRAQELLKWIQELAIKSPFTQEGIASAFRQALAYGFTTDEAQRLTQALTDFSAGAGLSTAQLGRIGLALGQVRAAGKLTGAEMRQLTEAGLGVRDILIEAGAEIGLTTENFEEMRMKGLIPAEFAIEAIVSALERDFGGAAERTAGTLQGLRSTMSDLRQVGLREFFTGTFTAIQPYLAAFVDKFIEAMPRIKEVGDAIGQWVSSGLADIAELVSGIGAIFQSQGLEAAGRTLIGLLFPPEIADEVKEIFSRLAEQITQLFQQGQDIAQGPLGRGLQQLASKILPAVEKALQFVIEHWDGFMGALKGVAALLGGGVIAGAITAVIALLGSLLTPVNLLIAAAALIGAAWEENWFGIQDIVTKVVNTLSPIITGLVDSLKNIFSGDEINFDSVGKALQNLGIPPETVASIRDGLVNAFIKANEAIVTLKTNLTEAWDALKSGLDQNLPALETAQNVLGKLIPPETAATIMGVVDGLISLTKYLNMSFTEGDALNDWLTHLPEGVRPVVQAFGEWQAKMGEVGKDIVAFAGEQAAAISDWVKENGPLIREFGQVLAKVAAIVGGVLAIAWAKMQTAILGMWNVVKPILGGIVELFLNAAKFIMQVVTGDFTGAFETWKEVPGIVFGAIKKAVLAFLNEIAGWFGTSLEGIGETWSKVWGLLENITNLAITNLVIAIAELGNKIIAWFWEFWGPFTETWSANWEMLVGIVTTIWTNIITWIQLKVQEFQALWQQGWDTVRLLAETAWTSIRDTILNFLTNLFASMGLSFDEMAIRWEAIWFKVGLIAQEIWERIVLWITEKALAVITTIQTYMEQARAVWEAVWNTIHALLVSAWAAIVAVVTGRITEAVNWIQTKLKEAQLIWTTVWMAIQVYLTQAWQAIVKTVQTWLLNAYNEISGKLKEIQQFWSEKWTEVKETLSDIFTDIVKAVAEKGLEIIQAVKDFIGEAQKWLGEQVKNFTQVGRDIIGGILGGLAERGGEVIEWLTGLAEDAIAAVMERLGIGSPSRVFWDIGEDMILGMVGGIEQMASRATDAAGRAAGDAADRAGEVVLSRTGEVGDIWNAFGKTIGEALVQGVSDMQLQLVAEIQAAMEAGEITAAEGAEQIAEIMGSTLERLLDAAGGLSGIGSSLAGMFEDQTLGPLQDLLEQREEQIDQNMAFLQDAFERTGARSLGDLLIREQQGLLTDQEVGALHVALALEQERAGITQDIAEAEAHILELKEQQQKLDFLQTQLDLLNLLQEHGLDAAEILGGMELGVNASIEGLLDAMTAAMEAIIGQAEEELQIASPSRVFGWIGQQLMAGLKMGIEAAAGLPTRAMETALGRIAAPAFNLPQPQVIVPPVDVYADSSQVNYNLSLATRQTDMSAQQSFRLMEKMRSG